MSDAFDTGGPQGPPPTSTPGESVGGGAGAGLDLDRLARLANEATPGPWEAVVDVEAGDVCVVESGEATWDSPLTDPGNVIASLLDESEECAGNAAAVQSFAADARFIAAADPQSVLALVERVKALEAVAEAARPVSEGIVGRAGSFLNERLIALRAALAAAGGGAHE